MASLEWTLFTSQTTRDESFRALSNPVASWRKRGRERGGERGGEREGGMERGREGGREGGIDGGRERE